MRMLHVETQNGYVNIPCEYIKELDGSIIAMNQDDEMIGVFKIGTFDMLYLSGEKTK